MNIIRCPAQALSADFGDIVIGNVVQNLDFTVTFNQAIILQESYVPDNAGMVYIRDMALLAGMYRQENSLLPEITEAPGTITFNLKFSESGQTITQDITIYTCETETAGTLSFAGLQTMPLTRCFRKNVCPGQQEYISFYGSGNVSLDIVFTGAAQDSYATFVIATPATATTIYRLDVSPSVVANLAGITPGRIVYYTVYKDRLAVVKFTMNKYAKPEKTFVFINSFGAHETFTCTGDSENERKWTREYGRTGHRQQLVSRELETTHTAHTGYLTREQAGIVEDLLNSRTIALIDQYGWHPVVIAEETFKVVSRRDELIDVQFKYRIASGNHLQYRHNPYKYRIFDDTFNNTFN